jgi:hypothetical protein
MANRRPIGNWLVRLALVLMIVSSTVRYFGASPTTDVIARWILWVDVSVGGLGIDRCRRSGTLATCARRRHTVGGRPAPGSLTVARG